MDQNTEIDYPYVDHQACTGYLKPTLELLKVKVGDIPTMLDIGAAHGHFCRQFLETWPDAAVTALDCNPLDSHYHQDKPWTYRNVCLGDCNRTATFYTDRNDPVGGGSSIYLENTDAFVDPQTETVTLVPLDSLNLRADFIKMDTQGSEVDIIKGGQETIGAARFLLIEMSLLRYNEGGCLIDDVLEQTRKLGFRLLATSGPVRGAHWVNYQQVQIDGLFAKENEDVFSMVE